MKNGEKITFNVAPYMGAWIEIFHLLRLVRFVRVAPYMGAWIEMWWPESDVTMQGVAPYMGAWIEIAPH